MQQSPLEPKSSKQDVLNALLALGYNEREAIASVKNLDKGIGVSEGIKEALQMAFKINYDEKFLVHY